MDDSLDPAHLDLAQRRAAMLGLTGPPLGTPVEVVGHLVAVQSQDFGPAGWSVAHRSSGPVDRASIEQLIDDGALLRTHVLRPTWHFVRPDDIGWLLALTGPRVQAFNAGYYRRNQLDPGTLDHSLEVITQSLADGHLSRAELAAALLDHGIDTAADIRLSLVVMNAELAGVICNGRRRGMQQTYALLSERAPAARRLDRDQALRELVLRYFTSHGPSSVHDMAWWSSLSLTEIRSGLAGVGDQLIREEHDGTEYWSAADPRPVADRPRTRLLQGFDEYIVGYSRTKWLLDPTGTARRGWADRSLPNLTILHDTAVVGGWKVTEKVGVARIEAALHAQPSAGLRRDLDQAGQAYGRYIGKPVEVSIRVL